MSAVFGQVQPKAAKAKPKAKPTDEKKKRKSGGASTFASSSPSSIYHEYGRSDRGTFACAVYMARAVYRNLQDLEEIENENALRLSNREMLPGGAALPPSTEERRARRQRVNRERAEWLLKAWSRYIASYPTGERVEVPRTRAELAAGVEPRYEILEPTIEQCSMFPEERALLKFALSKAVLGADGVYTLQEVQA